MSCREAAGVLRALGGRDAVTDDRLDELADHVTDCELCREELLDHIAARPTGTPPAAAGALRDAVAECGRVRERLRAEAAAGHRGPSADPEVVGHLGWCASCARRVRQYTSLLDRAATWASVAGSPADPDGARVVELSGRDPARRLVLRMRHDPGERPAFEPVPVGPGIGMLPAARVLKRSSQSGQDHGPDGVSIALPGSDLTVQLWPRGAAAVSGAVLLLIKLAVGAHATQLEHAGISILDDTGATELSLPPNPVPFDFEMSLYPRRTMVLVVRYRPQQHDRDLVVRLPIALDDGPRGTGPHDASEELAPVPAAPTRGRDPYADGTGSLRPATLSVTTRTEDDRMHLTYQLTVPLPGGRDLRRNAKIIVSRAMLVQLCANLAAASLDAEHRTPLREYGTMSFRMLFPDLARRVTDELIGWRGPLVISSDETLVPWELLYSRSSEFLGITHAIGRQVVGLDVEGGRPLRGLRTALVVTCRPDDPEDGQRQAEMVLAALPGVDVTVVSGGQATPIEVLRALGRGPDLLHYFGHVDIDEATGSGSLRLTGGTLDAATIAAQIAPAGEEAGGAPPIVFVNGCESAATLSGICSAFIRYGTTIAIGTLFPITPGAAAAVARDWYSALTAGRSAGEALREARQAQVRGRHGGWGAFALFGDPTTTLTEPRDEPVRPLLAVEIEGVSWPDLESMLTPDAVDLIRTAALMAAVGDGLTSMHLAAALVVTPGTPIALAVDEAGLPADELARLLCASAQAEETSAARSGQRVLPMTPNFAGVVEAAHQAAQERDGGRGGIADIAEAFLDRDCAGRSALASVDIGRDTLRPALTGNSPADVFDGRDLQTAYLDRATRQAVKAAWMMQAGLNQRLVSSGALLLGFGLTGSATLRGALHEQGEAGDYAVRVLFPQASSADLPNPRAEHFSDRSRAALERAYRGCRDDGSESVSDAAVLVEAIADDGSEAVRLLRRCNVDVPALRATLRAVIGSEPR